MAMGFRIGDPTMFGRGHGVREAVLEGPRPSDVFQVVCCYLTATTAHQQC